MTLDEFKQWLDGNEHGAFVKIAIPTEPFDLSQMLLQPKWLRELELNQASIMPHLLGILYLARTPGPLNGACLNRFNFLFHDWLEKSPTEAIAFYQERPQIQACSPSLRWTIAARQEELAEDAITLREQVSGRISTLRAALGEGVQSLSMLDFLFNPQHSLADNLAGLIYLLEMGVAPQQLIESGIFHQFFAQHFVFLDVVGSDFHHFYDFLKSQPGIVYRQLLQGLDQTGANFRGAESYNLLGLSKHNLKQIQIRPINLEFPHSSATYDRLFALWPQRFLRALIHRQIEASLRIGESWLRRKLRDPHAVDDHALRDLFYLCSDLVAARVYFLKCLPPSRLLMLASCQGDRILKSMIKSPALWQKIPGAHLHKLTADYLDRYKDNPFKCLRLAGSMLEMMEKHLHTRDSGIVHLLCSYLLQLWLAQPDLIDDSVLKLLKACCPISLVEAENARILAEFYSHLQAVLSLGLSPALEANLAAIWSATLIKLNFLESIHALLQPYRLEPTGWLEALMYQLSLQGDVDLDRLLQFIFPGDYIVSSPISADLYTQAFDQELDSFVGCHDPEMRSDGSLPGQAEERDDGQFVDCVPVKQDFLFSVLPYCNNETLFRELVQRIEGDDIDLLGLRERFWRQRPTLYQKAARLKNQVFFNWMLPPQEASNRAAYQRRECLLRLAATGGAESALVFLYQHYLDGMKHLPVYWNDLGYLASGLYGQSLIDLILNRLTDCPKTNRGWILSRIQVRRLEPTILLKVCQVLLSSPQLIELANQFMLILAAQYPKWLIDYHPRLTCWLIDWKPILQQALLDGDASLTQMILSMPANAYFDNQYRFMACIRLIQKKPAGWVLLSDFHRGMDPHEAAKIVKAALMACAQEGEFNLVNTILMIPYLRLGAEEIASLAVLAQEKNQEGVLMRLAVQHGGRYQAGYRQVLQKSLLGREVLSRLSQNKAFFKGLTFWQPAEAKADEHKAQLNSLLAYMTDYVIASAGLINHVFVQLFDGDYVVFSSLKRGIRAGRIKTLADAEQELRCIPDNSPHAIVWQYARDMLDQLAWVEPAQSHSFKSMITSSSLV